MISPLDENRDTAPAEPIAIVGLACRVPGAGDATQFWRNLIDGVESLRTFTLAEQAAEGVAPRYLNDPNFVPSAMVLDDMEYFDAALFGMTGREAEVRDPQQRLFLELAHTALEDAGYDPLRFPGDIGVYGGIGADEYQWRNIRRNPKVLAAAGALAVITGNHPDYLATLAAYKLNLRGPAVTVHTACSSSLVALHLACEALRNGECDMALTGAASIELPHRYGYLYHEGGINSPDGHLRAFDAAADGTVWGSGGGVVVLRRLADALADGDNVRAVIRGNAVNNDGADKVGFSAPSVDGQVAVIANALGVAGVDPRTVSYVEAHGTGTALGDPIEISALTSVFGRDTDATGWCAVASVKTNIGHLGPAAGVAGVIKTVLALEHRLIPPIVNFERPHEKIDFEASPFYVNMSLARWDGVGTPRRAGVSSFGIGGTNAHVVLEEAPRRPEPVLPEHPYQLVQLSARTGTALAAATGRLADHLAGWDGGSLGDVAFTLRHGRARHRHRAAVVAQSPTDTAAALRDHKRLITGTAAQPPRIAFLLSGQGSQYAGMGAQLYANEPLFTAAVNECAAILGSELGRDIRELMFPAAAGVTGAQEALGRTEYAQPALFTLEYALARLWWSWGVVPDAMIGHSIGEYVAATLAGVFDLPTALWLVAVRGRLMQSMPPGSMLAVTRDEEEVRLELPAELAIATVNGPGTCVVAGPRPAVDQYALALADQGIGTKMLRTSHAYHSPMMEPILAEFREQVVRARPGVPRMPFLSNVTGDWITSEQAGDPSYWADHLRGTVRFGDCVRTLLADGDRLLVEVGPGRQLAGLARRYVARDMVAPVASLPAPADTRDDLRTIYEAAARLWVAGVEVEVDAARADTGAGGTPVGRRVALPTYPYERRYYWVSPVDSADHGSDDEAGYEAEHGGTLPLSDWFAVPAWHQVTAAEPVTVPDCLFFGDGPLAGAVAGRLRERGVPVCYVGAGTGPGGDPDARMIRPDSRDDMDALLASLGDRVPARIVHAYALDGAPAGTDPDAAWRAQDRGFFSLLALTQALAGAAPGGAVHLDVLTDRTQDVTGTDLARPEHATVSGPVRVLGLELPWLTVRHIDLDATRPGAAGEAAAELGLAPHEAQVALRGGRRWVQRYEPVRLDADGEPPLGVRPGAVAVITGGLGGIGITVAEDLATRAGAAVVLVARGGLPERAGWDEHLAVHGTRGRTGRAIAAIRRIEQAGGQVLVHAGDVTSTADMRALRAAVLARFGRVDVLIHAAGVPGSGMAEVKAREQAEAVLAPKLLGTLALRAAFGDLPLDAVVLCSSITGIAGGFGQVDYCAANAYLDAVSRGGHGFTARVLALNWGGWLEVGMAAEVAAPDAFRAVQRGLVSTPVSHPVLSTVHRNPAAEVAYASGVIGPGTHWVLDEHRIHGSAVLPGTGHLETIRAAAAAVHGDRRDGQLVDLRDVIFVEPMAVADTTRAEIRVAFADGADIADFTVSSQSAGRQRTHARGSAGWAPAGPAPVHDVAAIRARCRLGTLTRDGQPSHSDGQPSHSGMLTFGPRWSSLRRVEVGVDEEIAYLEAGEQVAAELDRWVLHPALLDEATSFGTSRGAGRYLPMGYGRLLVRSALPARLWSHLRYRGDATNAELVVADITLLDEAGTEVVAITEFMLRRVDADAVGAAVATGATATDVEVSTGTDTVGISPADGALALHLVLASELGPQVAVTATDVRRIMAAIRRVNQGALEAGLDPVAGQRAERTATGAYVAARTELEQSLCALWEGVLGAGQVGVEDDFFDLGGNSLVAVQLIASIRKAVGTGLPMRSLFEAPTVAGMAAVIERLRTEDPSRAGTGVAGITALRRRS